MHSKMYPLSIEPRASRRLWGGDRLSALLGADAAQEREPIGEAWLVYAENAIRNGPLAGRTLQDVADEAGDDLVGTAAAERYGTQVPLLVKLIDAALPLSIQVHPDDAYARSREADTGHLGKEEAWYVLEADTGAEIVWGFERPLDPHIVRDAIDAGELERYLNRVPVEPGDVVYNPAGTVHAIGGGIFLFEVQQSSDLTYRLYDYNRRDADGNPRELHVDKALEVADLSTAREAKVAPRAGDDGWVELVRTPFFLLERREVRGVVTSATSPRSMHTLTFVSGEGRVAAADASDAADVAFGVRSVVLPASLGGYRVEGEGELLRCRLPDR